MTRTNGINLLSFNVLQKRSPVAAKRQARLIKARLSPMTAELWEIIVNGSADITTRAVLAAAIKHSRLLADFMDSVIRQHWQTFNPKISTRDWSDYLKKTAPIPAQHQSVVGIYT